jgi:hypothetical protein
MPGSRQPKAESIRASINPKPMRNPVPTAKALSKVAKAE